MASGGGTHSQEQVLEGRYEEETAFMGPNDLRKRGISTAEIIKAFK